MYRGIANVYFTSVRYWNYAVMAFVSCKENIEEAREGKMNAYREVRHISGQNRPAPFAVIERYAIFIGA